MRSAHIMAPKRSTTGSVKSKKEEVSLSSDKTQEYTKIILELSKNAPPKMQPYIEKGAPYIAKFIMFCVLAAPHIFQAIHKIDELVQRLPLRIIRAIIGFTVCFFGGVFPLTIAAVEAWKQCGGDQAIASLKELRNEFVKVADANKKDDDVDADHDGTADVLQMSGQELVTHKAKLIAKVVKPEMISTQLTLLYSGWVAVLATLKIQFAKTIALGAAIGHQLYGPCEKFVQPLLSDMTPDEYKHWVPWGLKWGCKAIAVYIAWWIQRIISAFHSAIRGGLMCGRELVDFANEKGYIKTSSDDTHLDEIVGWSLAGLGLVVQFMLGFAVPFPLSLVMWPMYFVEGAIAWTIY